jgi:hypothetical protein
MVLTTILSPHAAHGSNRVGAGRRRLWWLSSRAHT